MQGLIEKPTEEKPNIYADLHLPEYLQTCSIEAVNDLDRTVKELSALVDMLDLQLAKIKVSI